MVQDLVLRVHTVRYRRERWLTPDGETVTAALPSDVTGHFGPALRRFLLAQCHQGQVTAARLLDQVRPIGIDISRRHFVRLLIDGQDLFREEARDVLRAGLKTARRITVDDDEALASMRERSLSCSAIALLAHHPVRRFADEEAWMAHLQALGLPDLDVLPEPVGTATEVALRGSVEAHGFPCEAVVVGDDAGRSDVGHHALCRVRAERLVPRLDAFTGERRRIQRRIRSLIRWFCRDLLAFKCDPRAPRRAELEARFGRACRDAFFGLARPAGSRA